MAARGGSVVDGLSGFCTSWADGPSGGTGFVKIVSDLCRFE